MKHLPSIFLIAAVLCACATAVATPASNLTASPAATAIRAPSSPAPTAQPTQPLSPTRVATAPEAYEVITWFHNPVPQLGDTVLMFASLLQNGRPMSGDMMNVTWPDERAPGGLHVCWDKPNYARGICCIKVTEQYSPGQPVPITVTMSWLGEWYTGQAEFTPR